MLLIICIVLFILSMLIYLRSKTIISLLFMILSSTFYGSYKLLEITRNYIYFYFSILFTMLISAFLLQFLEIPNKPIQFLYGFLFIICSLIYMGCIKLIYNIKQNNLNEAPPGRKGKQGDRG